MLSNLLFWIIPAVYGVYLFVVVSVFKRAYVFEIDDVGVILDRFLILGLFGLLISSLIAYFGLKSRFKMKKVVGIPVICALALIIGYYFFVPTAVEMAAWMEVPRQAL